MSILKKLSDTIKAFSTRKDIELPAFLGNLSGTVKADNAYQVYVTLLNGEVITAHNGKVPNVPRLPVIVGYAPNSSQLEILRARDVFTRPPYPEVPPHALLHTFPGVDTIPIRGEQFLPGLVTPAGGVTVKVYGFIYQLADGWHVVPTQTVDLSSHVPSTGALYVLLQVDDTGTITVTDGTAVDTREELGLDDIPAADSAQFVVAAIKLYNSQTNLIFTVTDTDIVDLRWGRGGSGGSTASAISVTDTGGFFAGSNVEDILQELGLDGRSFATIVSSMGTTTLTATSATVQMVTGTSLHTVDLPDTSTIFTSKKFHIINRSTQIVVVRSSTGVSLLTLGPGTDNVFTCTSTADNLATAWKWFTFSEDTLIFSDVATADSSTTKHGLLRKLSGIATEFMNGLGNWVALTASDIASGTFDAARLPVPTTTALGGVKRNTGSAGQFVKGIDSAGALEYDTPAGGGASVDTIRTKYIITPSVASNDLTLALKYIDGNDPTSTNKLTFRVGDTEYDLTAAMSFTKNDGTNWMNCGSTELAAKNVQFFVYAIGETGGSAGLKFGFSRIPYARTMGDFVNTTTDEKYIAGNWTNFNSTDAVTLIGRFQAQLSGSGTSYLWSIPTANVINYPIDRTDILTWQPSYSATGSMTYTSVTTTVAEYQVVGRRVNYELVTIGTTGGTAAPAIRATLPFKVRNYAANLPSVGWTADGGGTIAACMFIDATTANLLACRRYDGANYGLGANRYIAYNGSCAL